MFWKQETVKHSSTYTAVSKLLPHRGPPITVVYAELVSPINMSYEFCSNRLFLWEISHFCISGIVLYLSCTNVCYFEILGKCQLSDAPVKPVKCFPLVVVKDHVKRMIKQPRDPCQRAQDNLWENLIVPRWITLALRIHITLMIPGAVWTQTNMKKLIVFTAKDL